jgi:hypothetical protein
MDDRRFDALTRSLALGFSRRSVIRGFFGGAIAGVAAAVPTRIALAQCSEDEDCGPCERCDEGSCEPILLICEEGQRTCCVGDVPTCAACCIDDHCGTECGLCILGQCDGDTALCPGCEVCINLTCQFPNILCLEGTKACCVGNEVQCQECCADEECAEIYDFPPGGCLLAFCADGECAVSQDDGACDTGTCCCEVDHTQAGHCLAQCCSKCAGDLDCPESTCCCPDGSCDAACCDDQPMCLDDLDCPKDTCCCKDGTCSPDCCEVVCRHDRDCPHRSCCCNDWTCSSHCCEEHKCRHDRDCPHGACCCADGTCANRCCDRPDKEPDPKRPPEVHTLPSTGSGADGGSTGTIGAIAGGAALAYLARKTFQQQVQPEVPQE